MGLELVGRVTRTSLIILAPVSLAAGLLGGGAGALGALAGGLLSLASLWWLSRGVRSAGAFFAGGRAHPLWMIALGGRYTLFFGAVALLLWSGAVHPVGLLAGLSVVPPVLILIGLRASRAAA